MGLLKNILASKAGSELVKKAEAALAEKNIGMDAIKEISGFFSQQQAKELLSGQFTISEEMINSRLKSTINHKDIEDFSISFLSDNEIRIDIQHKEQGHISTKGYFGKFVHNYEQSSFTFRIVEKKFHDKGWFANLVSDIGLKIMGCLWGSYNEKNFGGMKISLGSDKINVDFREFILDSQWHQKKIMGTSIVDMVEVLGAESVAGGLKVSTNLNVSETLKLAFELYIEYHFASHKSFDKNNV